MPMWDPNFININKSKKKNSKKFMLGLFFVITRKIMDAITLETTMNGLDHPPTTHSRN